MLEPAVDCLGGAVGRAGTVEVGQHVGGPLLQRASERDDFDQRVWDTGADRVDQLDHQFAPPAPVLVPVGGDHPLVDAPGGLDLGMDVVGEQRGEPSGLLVGEQSGTGVQGPAREVERVVLTATPAVQVLADTSAALVQRLRLAGRRGKDP